MKSFSNLLVFCVSRRLICAFFVDLNMEVYLAIDYPLTSKVPQKYPVPKLHYGTGIEFEYTWIVECQPLVKLTDAEKFSREVVKKIEKIRG